MIAIIRITGQVNVNKDVKETLDRLRLKRKYVCVVIKPGKENLGMLKRVKDFVAYGEISDETLKKLIEKRGQLKDKKTKTTKTLENIKPFFRLHPPRKGIDSKKHFGVNKGVLGNNKEKINDLIERML